MNPLAYALGLARAASSAGVRLFENTRALSLGDGPSIVTDQGTIRARNILVAANAYLDGLEPWTAARVMPINSYVVATEPLGDLSRILAEPIAVADSRFVINYYRPTPDARLVFGGGESYGYRFPADIAAKVRRPLEATFPQLKGVRITHAWGGSLAITRNRMPVITRVRQGVFSASGYSGHGVAMAGLAGRIVAQAIQGTDSRFDVLSSVTPPPFPGGTRLRAPLLTLAMTWYSLRDRLGL